jgi:pimeloyl-ACP methyl ester carboxylesterase
MVQRLILMMPVGQVAFGRRRLPKRYSVFSRVPLFSREFYRRYLSTRVQIRAWLKKSAFVDPEKITEETIEVLTNCAQQFGAERAIIQWMSGRFNLDLEKRLAELSQPVTLIWGEKAADPPLESGHGLESVAKQSNLVVLANAGVLVALESPMPVIEALAKELDPTIHLYKTG